MIIARGLFTPGQGHMLRGSFTISSNSGALVMATSDDFFFDGSPDPGFAFNEGMPTNAGDPELQALMVRTRFLDLPGNVVTVQGRQSGPIPSTLDVGAFNTLVLWCFRFPFILGYAPIERV